MLLLALYIVVDFGTPLLPGAFRFEMNESIEVGGRPGLRMVVSIVDGAVAPNRVRLVRHDPAPTLGPTRRPNGAAPRMLDVPRPARTDSPSDSFEDH